MKNEFKEIQKAIDSWVKANKGNVSFIGSFISIDEEKVKNNAEDVTKDILVIGYGGKEELGIHIEELNDCLVKEEGFVNW